MPLFLAIFFSLSFLLSPAQTQAQETEAITAAAAVETILIETPYAFATMPGGVTGAVFMKIKNTGNTDDSLIKVKSTVAKHTEIHENEIDPDDGKMMMRKIKNVPLSTNGEAVLEPTGKHIMLIKLKEPLTLDSTFPLTLVFKNAGEKIITVTVIQPGTKPDMEEEGEEEGHSHHDHNMDHDKTDNFPPTSFSDDNDDAAGNL